MLDTKTEKVKRVISFSGGSTSAYMARLLQLKNTGDYDLKYVFANTGCEAEETLQFIDRCAKEWDMDIVWIEARVIQGRVSSQFNLVDFETAAREGEPFERVIEKYGIPNPAYPHCTRELKVNPMNAWIKSIGWKDQERCIGIRVDEIDRMSKLAKKNKLVYPLISPYPTNSAQIYEWWAKQPFKLELDQFKGNCTTCYKKTYRKLATVMQETPEAFDFFERMEKQHGLSGHNLDGTKRKFFRGHRTVQDIRDMAAKSDFIPFVGNLLQKDPLLEATNGCSESCEAFGDESLQDNEGGG